MKKAILIHGYNNQAEYLDVSRPSPSNDHWFPWLQRQLLLNQIETQTPEMPGFFQPNYEKWKEMLDIFSPDENTILVGHSCGAGFLVRWLSEATTKVGKVVLVAPWLDPNHEIDKDFFNFTIDADIAKKTKELIILFSTDDEQSVLDSVARLKNCLINVSYVEFKDKGHFVLSSLGSEKFPELLEIILK